MKFPFGANSFLEPLILPPLGTRLCLGKAPSGESLDYRDVIVIQTLCFQNVFRPHENEKVVFSLKFILIEECFRKTPDGLV